MRKKITVTEIAKLAGVSPATVSLVLNSRAGVSQETRDRVLKIAREHSYKGVSSGDQSSRHKTLLFVSIVKHGHILNKNHKTFVADYIDGAQLEAGRKGYSLEVVSFDGFVPTEIIGYINSSHAKGAVILGTELDEKDLQHFLRLKIPAAFIDLFCTHMPYDFVDMNNDSSVYNMLTHLTAAGHTNIGIVTGSIDTANFSMRRSAFEKTMKILGHKFRPEFVFTVDSTYEGAYQDMLDVLKTKPALPTALFCVNDIIAIGCIRALKESGIRVPDDISVAGFDNLPMTSMLEPPLTTVKVSKKKISMTAVMLLIRRIKDGSTMPYEKIMIGGEVVKRHSVRQIG
ncbi:MAG: LacI family DNA-binding transcriptional regulator [Deferribacterales bacterium]